jgi:hypothetical protein
MASERPRGLRGVEIHVVYHLRKGWIWQIRSSYGAGGTLLLSKIRQIGKGPLGEHERDFIARICNHEIFRPDGFPTHGEKRSKGILDT